jgi:hypothetical protein
MTMRSQRRWLRNLHLKSVLLKNEAKLDQQFLQATESLLGPEIATTMH